MSFALEGRRDGRNGSSRAFLIIDDNLLKRANAQTNQTLSVDDIQRAYEALALGRGSTRRKIPAEYTRVGDLPKNDIGLDVEMYYPGGGWTFLLPVAFLLDVGTFPLQAIYTAAGGDPGWNL